MDLISLNETELNRIFPFHLALSEDLIITSVGKSLHKTLPELNLSTPFFNFWTVTRPSEIQEDKNGFKTCIGKLLVMHPKNANHIIFKGHFEHVSQQNMYVFFGSPSFTDTNQILENNLSINDFAHNNSLVDLLLVLKNTEISNSELKELLERLRVQKNDLQLFQNIINSSSDAIQVGFEDGRLFYINETASARLGIAPHEVHKYRIQDFEELFQVDPLYWDRHLKLLKTEDYLLVEGENINQKTGRRFPVEVTAKYVNVGGTGMVVGISRDISQRKASELQLSLQEKKYRNIISNMNLGLLEVDNDDIIKFSNKGFTAISGYSRDELVGKKASALFVSDLDLPEVTRRNENRKNGEADSYEIQVTHKSGESRWWLVSGAPNYNDRGEIIGSIGIHLDITDQKQLENDLAQALNKAQDASVAKEAFLANMSHEIRTPLNAIIGTIRELNREELNEQQTLILRHSHLAANHLLSIVNSILDMSKIEAGEFELDMDHFSLQALFSNLESILKGKAESKDLQLKVDIDPKIDPAHIGDGPRLRQIFINLLDNALKFTVEGGVTVKLKLIHETEENQTIQFVVSDTGIGMDDQFLSEIFSKFTQEERSTSRKYGGTGLGMPITHEVVQLMGGDINITSEKGQGTQFYVKITFDKGDIKKLTPENREVPLNALQGTRVLLVEDNEVNRFIALQSLQYMGCIVDEANNGNIAIDKLQNKAFDIVLMDIQMPEKDGIETTKHIRNQMGSDIPIVAVTANAFKEDIELYLKIGMNDYVTKPFEEYRLFESISASLGIPVHINPGTSTSNPSDSKLLPYDLKSLKSMSKGDDKFVQKMIDIFKSTTPVVVNDMRQSLKNKDYIRISQLAHKIKPSIDNMGISALEGKAAELEALCKQQGVKHDQVAPLLSFFTAHLESVLSLL